MPKFQILGRVLPDPLKVTIPSRDIHWIDGNGVEANFKIRIAGSLINIECEPLNAISDNIALLIIRAFDLARASVNLVAFATAQGLSVSFDFVIGEDGTPQYLVPNDLPLASLCTAYHIEIAEEVSKMYEIIVGDVDLSRALNELILSISTPHVSPLAR